VYYNFIAEVYFKLYVYEQTKIKIVFESFKFSDSIQISSCKHQAEAVEPSLLHLQASHGSGHHLQQRWIELKNIYQKKSFLN